MNSMCLQDFYEPWFFWGHFLKTAFPKIPTWNFCFRTKCLVAFMVHWAFCLKTIYEIWKYKIIFVIFRSHLKLTEDQLHNEASYKFNAALQARLSRRQLPSVSPEGLILYTSRFPPTSNGTYWKETLLHSVGAWASKSKLGSQQKSKSKIFLPKTLY